MAIKTNTANAVVREACSNIISALGCTTKENFENAMNGVSGIKPTNDTTLYPTPFLSQRINDEQVEKNIPVFSSLDSKEYTRLERLMIASVSQATSSGDFNEILKSERTIFIFSTTKGNVRLLEQDNQHPQEGAFLYQMAQKVAGYFGAKNEPVIVSQACISGVVAQLVAERLLKAKEYETAIVIGGDELTEFTISGFQSFKSVSEHPCRPYDAKRDGLSMGEGVATIVYSTLPQFDTPQAIFIKQGSTSNDANHISGPSRTGEELGWAIKSALQSNGHNFTTDAIDAHGTATLYNDEMESKAIGVAGLTDKELLSLKGYFGHTLGASGLLETVICNEGLRQQRLPSTLGFSELGVPIPVNVRTQSGGFYGKSIVKTASGFGGCNAAILLGKDADGSNTYHLHRNYRNLAQCSIADKAVKTQGKVIFDGSKEENFGTFIRAAFKNISEPYAKFPKMDDLCKLAVTAVEYLWREADHSQENEYETALLIATTSSSLDTDLRHQQSIAVKDPYIPSPAIFVYTLNNIMEGEICIRHKIKGENLCLVCKDKAEAQKQLRRYADLLLSNHYAKRCIVGYVDYLQGKYEADFEDLGC
ncbi:MAG: beta-ACP synthase [Bacteroidales bacterium]|nr:beta-ACP synthase [Candidatus Physcocola equi]